MRNIFIRFLGVLALLLCTAAVALAQCPASVPVAGGTLPGPLPLFPAANWWNLDISAAPVDPAPIRTCAPPTTLANFTRCAGTANRGCGLPWP